MTRPPFVSYAQNGEDVVLFRALGHLEHGRYVEVGANDPADDSISRAFYDLGWRGITVEPVAEFADRQREQRPGDLVIQAAATDVDGGTATLHRINHTGLSTLDDAIAADHRAQGVQVADAQVATRTLDDILAGAGWDGSDIHFMTIDTEGTEETVLRGLDLGRWRPWVLVVEATLPNSTTPSHAAWEPQVLAAGYRFCLFDGLSRFYVAAEHADELAPRLGYPACIHDHYVPAAAVSRERELQRLGTAAADLTADRDRIAAERDDVTADRDRIAEDRDQLAAQVAAERERTAQVQAQLETERTEHERTRSGLLRWRAKALAAWGNPAAGGEPGAQPGELVFLRRHAHALTQELEAIRRTVSWRVTKPLRVVRSAAPRRRR